MAALEQGGLRLKVTKPGLILGRRWSTIAAIWFSMLIILFPLAYAALVSTQTNAEVFSFQLTPGSGFRRHLDQVWNERNLGRMMWNSLV